MFRNADCECLVNNPTKRYAVRSASIQGQGCESVSGELAEQVRCVRADAGPDQNLSLRCGYCGFPSASRALTVIVSPSAGVFVTVIVAVMSEPA
jgi:hypothetical protein